MVNEALNRQSIFFQPSAVPVLASKDNKSTQPNRQIVSTKSVTIETPATSKASPVTAEKIPQPKKKTLSQPLHTPVFTLPSGDTVASSDPSQEKGVIKRIQKQTAMTFAAVGSVAGSLIVPAIMKSVPSIIGTQFVVAFPLAGVVAALAGLFFYV
mmetsp:Transcript_23136/g.35096  ORF Transcript_23136/g.35096 Transcript_23136/m.35096 type:complete len:155 (+) Transcript_23136:934-1398(+)